MQSLRVQFTHLLTRGQNDADVKVNLTRSAEKHLRIFVAEFLDSAFNRESIEQSGPLHEN